MQPESLILNFLSVFSLISFFIALIIQKNSGKIRNGILLDQDYSKPQAFHNTAIARSGGLASIISIIIFFILYESIFQKFFVDFFVVSTALFLLGFSDDIKIKIKPRIRLALMIILLSFCIIFFSINIKQVDLNFLDLFLNNKIFQVIFVLLCFLFIINGSNLIDGFNGLLGIHLIIINSTLLVLNLTNGHTDLSVFILAQIIVLFAFLLFNFPNAKMFMGDGGAYFFGSLIALNVIKTNNLNPDVSSFFYCVILFYLFYEVFFSFFRKIFFKRNPLKPDNQHLHMLTFKKLKETQIIRDPNYINSILINLVYLIMIMPSIYFKHNGFFCRYWFLFLLLIYTVCYLGLSKNKK